MNASASAAKHQQLLKSFPVRPSQVLLPETFVLTFEFSMALHRDTSTLIGKPQCAALENTVSPSLPLIMSQFLHGRAEGRRVFKESEYKRQDILDFFGCNARTRYTLRTADVYKNKRFRGVHTWWVDALDRRNERFAIGSRVPLRLHTSGGYACHIWPSAHFRRLYLRRG